MSKFNVYVNSLPYMEWPAAGYFHWLSMTSDSTAHTTLSTTTLHSLPRIFFRIALASYSITTCSEVGLPYQPTSLVPSPSYAKSEKGSGEKGRTIVSPR